jgi:hypothetical protein
MYIHVYFMLLFDLTPYQAPSEEHVSPPTNGHIPLELNFSEPLPEAFNCLLYLEYDSSVRIDALRTGLQTISNNNGHATDSMHAS